MEANVSWWVPWTSNPVGGSIGCLRWVRFPHASATFLLWTAGRAWRSPAVFLNFDLFCLLPIRPVHQCDLPLSFSLSPTEPVISILFCPAEIFIRVFGCGVVYLYNPLRHEVSHRQAAGGWQKQCVGKGTGYFGGSFVLCMSWKMYMSCNNLNFIWHSKKQGICM